MKDRIRTINEILEQLKHEIEVITYLAPKIRAHRYPAAGRPVLRARTATAPLDAADALPPRSAKI